jgi:eukaryotic-like serine/threonine-protein kinase
MTPEQWDKIGDIFHFASALHPDERDGYLDQACDGDAELRREVESLLEAGDDAGDFISAPAYESLPVASLSAEAASLSGAFLGHYIVRKTIGSGGMGEVYLAVDTRLNRCVAVKRLPFPHSSDPVSVKRFRNEAQAAANLNHPNVATIYAVEEFNGKPFISMEYIDGKTLDNLIPPSGLGVKIFLDWFTQLADALVHAHERGVTHRDIKPGNLMISSEGTPKILDFGLAQIAEDPAAVDHDSTTFTDAGHVAGTPSYMSPEQAEGKELDPRTDIFSFGVVMYEAITGVRPFTGDSQAELISNLLKSDPVPVSVLKPEVPPLLSQLIERCLEKKKNDRFQRMQEVATVLAEIDAVREFGSSTKSLGRKLFRETSSRQWKWLAATAALVMIAALSAWYYFYETRSEPPFNFANMTIRQLSQTNNVVFAHITADGKSVAYNTIEDNADRALWIRRVDDRNALQLVPPQPVQYWGGLTSSEDGSQIYYITAGRAARHGTMFRVSSLGGPPRKLVDTVNDLGSLSPDGKQILFVRYGDATQIITANSSDGGNERVLQSAPADVVFRDPQYSQDGRSIYYIRLDRVDGNELWSLVSLPVGGHEETVIVPKQKPRMNEIVVLGDNGLLLNAVDPASNLPQLFHLSLSTKQQARITNDLNSYFGISADRQGQTIVAAQRSEESRVWAGSASDTANLHPVTTEATAYLSVEWTPDGRLVYDAVEQNRPHIRIIDADGRGLLQLTSDESNDQEPSVSPDGRFIIFASDRSGEQKIWRMDLDGSNAICLTPVPGAATVPRFAPDGQTVIFNWDRGTERVLGQVPLTGGTIVEMPLYSDSLWALSPDGKSVAYTFWDASANKSKVATRILYTNELTAILDISPTAILKWSSDSMSLFYRDREAGTLPHTTVLKIDIATKQSRQFLSTAPDTVIDLAFSNDGSKVAILRRKLLTDAVMLTKVPQK